jgi:hypothetical protein
MVVRGRSQDRPLCHISRCDREKPRNSRKELAVIAREPDK